MLRNLKKALKKRLGIKSSPYLIENTDILTVGKMSFHNGGLVVQGSQHVQIGSYCALDRTPILLRYEITPSSLSGIDIILL